MARGGATNSLNDRVTHSLHRGSKIDSTMTFVAASNSQLISFVVPVFKREDDILHILKAIDEHSAQSRESLGKLTAIEVLFIDDGSFVQLPAAAQLGVTELSNVCVRLIRLSRNFGLHSALICGMKAARGDVVVRLNSDNWDLVEFVPTMISALATNRVDRCILMHESSGSVISTAFHAIERLITGIQRRKSESPVRVFSRTAVDQIIQVASSVNYTLELEDWLGLSTVRVNAMMAANRRGASTFSLRRKLRLMMEILAIRTGTGFQLVALSAVLLFALNGAIVIALISLALTGRVGGNGFVTLALLQIGLSSIQIAIMSLIGLVGSMSLREIQGRPPYIVASTEEFRIGM